MAYGALTGDLYSMAMGTTPGQQGGISVPQGLTSRQRPEDRDEKEAKPAGTITPKQLSLDDGSSLQETQASPMAGDQEQPKAMMSDIEASVASVSNQFALWFGDRYALSKEEQDLFEVMVSGSKDPVDTAGRYVASLALSKKTGMSIYKVYPRLDAISQYFTGETYRPNDATFSQKVNASFEAINISDLKGQWMRVVKEKGFDDPKAIALENEIFQREEAIGGIQNAIPTGFWDRVASGVLGSLGYTAEGIKYGAAVSVGTAAVTSRMVAGVAAANPIAGLAAASSAALYAAFSGAVASFQRTGELAEYDTFWDMMHMTDAEGNLMHRDVAAATFYAGLNRNITGFLETMVDGVISKGVSSFAPVVLQRFGVPNLTVKVLADRGVSGLSSRLAYAGMDWLAGGLNEGFLQEGPEQLATAVLNAAYVKTVGGAPDLSLKQLASDYFHSSFEGMLVGLAYGGVGIPQSMRQYNSTSIALRRAANAIPSMESFMDMTASLKPEGMNQVSFDSARGQIFDAARKQQAEWQAEHFGGTVLESEEIAAEELYSTQNPETEEETAPVPDGSIYRTPDTNALFTESREENGRRYVYAGDPTSGAVYGVAELSSDGDTLTVESVRVRPGYEGIREELVRTAISGQRTGESNIAWNPTTKGNAAVRDALIRNNPRGESAGLDYGADLSANQDHDIEALSSQIRTAMPNLSREESVVAARLYSIADSDSRLSALNNGKPVRNSDTLPSRYRGAADAAKAIIYAGKNSDFSTFYHELFHVNAAQRPSDARALSTAISNTFSDDASRSNLLRFIEDSKEIWGNAFDSDRVMKSLESIKADSDASQWTREQFEDLARLAEAYATANRRRQLTLSESIRNILAKIGELMRRVYQTVRQTVPLQKEIRDAYDRIMVGAGSSEATSPVAGIHNQNRNPVRQPLPENTYEAAIDMAKGAHPKFVRIVDEIRGLTGAGEDDVSIRKAFKGRARSIEKAEGDYSGDFSQILDYDGAMIQYDSISAAESAWNAVKERYKDRIVKEKHLITPSGYEDFKLNIRMDNGFIAEIQFLDRDILDMKMNGVGHELYEIERKIRLLIRNGESQLKNLLDGILEWNRTEYRLAKEAGINSEDYANSEARRNAISLVIRQASSDLSLYQLNSSSVSGLSAIDPSGPSGISRETGYAVAHSILNGISLISTNLNSSATSSSNQSIDPKGNGGNIMFQSAWHGGASSFGRFDTVHIGEGEGNQSFGWGLYFSTEEGVARNYAQIAVNRRKPIDSWGRRINSDLYNGLAFVNSKIEIPGESLTTFGSFFNSFYWKNDPTPRFTDRASLENSMDEYEGFRHAYILPGLSEKDISGIEESNATADERRAAVSDVLDRLSDDDIRQLSEKLFPKNRNLYSVEIPDGDYIEWYQAVPSEYISRIIEQAEMEGLADELVQNWESMDPDTRESVFTKTIVGIDPLADSTINNRGERLYRSISSALGSDRAASEFLNRAGFAGIKYPVSTLHGGNNDSYGNGANYVIFNADDIQINDHLVYQDEHPVDYSGLSDDEARKKERIISADERYADGDETALDEFSDDFIDDAEAIRDAADAEYFSRMYSDYDAEFSEETSDATDSLADENIPEYDPDAVNVKSDGSEASGMADYEDDVNENVIPSKLSEDDDFWTVELDDTEGNDAGSDSSDMSDADIEAIIGSGGILRERGVIDSLDTDITWKDFVARNRPESAVYEGTDAEKDDALVRAIQDDAVLSRYLGIIGEALYLNTNVLNGMDVFVDQAQRERLKVRVYDIITSRVIRNAAGQLMRGEGPLSPQRLASARREISDNARLYRNALSMLLNDDSMRPEKLIGDARGLDIPSRETLDAMPISQLRELARTARDAEIVSMVERGTLKVKGDADETRAEEINSALKSLADRVKSQEKEIRDLESANTSLRSSLDSLSSDIDERDRAIDYAVDRMRKIGSILSSGAAKLTDEAMEPLQFTDRMREIRNQLRLLSESSYNDIYRRRTKGTRGTTRDNAIEAARNEYITDVLMTFPDIFDSDYAKKVFPKTMNRVSDTGFGAVRKVLDAKMDELRSEWKDEAVRYMQSLSSDVRSKSAQVSKDIDAALNRMDRLQRDVKRQERLKERIKENRKGQIRRARTEERWKAAKKMLEREKRHSLEIANLKSFSDWKAGQQKARFADEIRDIKALARERESEIREEYRNRIDEMKREQRAIRKQGALIRAINREKAKLARSIMRPVNLNTTDYDTSAEAIMAIQAILDPHFRRDWLPVQDTGFGPVASGSTMTIEGAKKYLAFLSERGRNDVLSTLSPELVDRLTEKVRPLNDFTVYELRELARQVELLRKKGREVLAAKKAVQKEQRNEIVRSIVLAVKGRADRRGDTLPGSIDRLAASRSLRSTMNESLYATWRPDELSQLLDGGFCVHGPARHLLIDEKRYHQNRERLEVERRKKPINDMLTKDIADRFFEKHAVDLGDIKMVLSNDQLAYVYLSQFNEDTRDAVAYGDFLLEREKGTVENKLTLDNGEEVLRFVIAENGAIADDALLKGIGDRRYKIAVEYAERALEDAGIMPVVKAIEADFNSERNRERLMRASIEYFNKPMELLDYYLPIFRTDVKGNDFDNVTANSLFNLNTGEIQGSPEDGFTIPRVKGITPRHQRSVNLSLLSVWNESVENQEHLIEFSGYVKRLYSVFNNKELNAMVDQAYSPGLMHEIQSYIRLIANPLSLRDTNDKAANKLIRTGRGRLTTAYLSWKLSGIVMQAATSPWPFLREVNPVRLLSAYIQLAQGRTKLLDDIYSKSPMMKNRSMDMIIQEMMDRERNITESNRMTRLRGFEQKGMLGLEWVDRIAVAGGWLAKYQEQLEAGERAGLDTAAAEASAIKAADDLVLAVQPSGDATELPSLFRTTNEGFKALLQFQSSLSVIWNNMTADMIGFKRTKQYGKIIAGTLAYALAGITLGLAAEGFDDDDDGKDIARKLAYWALTQPVESIPIVGSTISSALQKAITGSADFYGSGFSLWPPIEKVSNGLQKLLSKDPEGLWSLAEGAALFTGLPVSGFKQAMKAMKGEPGALLGR